VSQDNSLFNLSILENLNFAKNDVTEKEITEAIKNSNADFILKLKN
jgi:ABC-type multidrug transport system fused ATPase/permease subunit